MSECERPHEYDSDEYWAWLDGYVAGSDISGSELLVMIFMDRNDSRLPTDCVHKPEDIFDGVSTGAAQFLAASKAGFTVPLSDETDEEDDDVDDKEKEQYVL